MIRIRLTWPEVSLAAHVGCMRNIMCLRQGRTPSAGQGLDDLWSANIEGAGAELAVAKHLGLFWAGNVGDYDAPDVGPYQVRCNKTRRTETMTLRPADKDHDIYISVLSFT